MKKVLIVDDEKAGRKLIKEYLGSFPEFVVISEANNGVDAVREINKFKPDLVFLDVQMPGLTGFQVLEHLEELPQIIFSTAYDKYALQAFEVHAVDYLLKPYTKERFRKAIEKLNQNKQQLGALAQSLLMEKPSYPERVLVQYNNKLITVSVDDINWIEAYGDYSRLHLTDQVYLSNYGISALEDRLDPDKFIRVHRSSMIQVKAIKELHKYGKSYDVTMQNGDVVRVSRGYMEALKKIML